jgi:hypothetical protein
MPGKVNKTGKLKLENSKKNRAMQHLIGKIIHYISVRFTLVITTFKSQKIGKICEIAAGKYLRNN